MIAIAVCAVLLGVPLWLVRQRSMQRLQLERALMAEQVALAEQAEARARAAASLAEARAEAPPAPISREVEMLRAENARLREENARLREELLRASAPPPPGGAGAHVGGR